MRVQKLARKLSAQTCTRSQLGTSRVCSDAQQSAPGEDLHDKAGLHMQSIQVPFQAKHGEPPSQAWTVVHTLKQPACQQAATGT